MSNQKSNISKIISQINEEGVKKAESEKEKIINQARAEATKIEAEAICKAKHIVEDAEKKASLLEESAEHQIESALKNATTFIKQEVETFLGSLLRIMLRENLSNSNLLAELITQSVKKWSNNEQLTIGLKDKDIILQLINPVLLEGKTLIINNSIHGFTIKSDQESVTWEVTDESINELLTPLLSSRIAEIFKNIHSDKEELVEEQYHG